MSEPVIYKGLEWTPEPDEEFNQHTTQYKGHTLVVYSNRDESKWHHTVDGEEGGLSKSTMEKAMDEAVDDADL